MAHHIPIHNINEILLITNTSISQIGIVYRACLIYQLINICKCAIKIDCRRCRLRTGPSVVRDRRDTAHSAHLQQ